MSAIAAAIHLFRPDNAHRQPTGKVSPRDRAKCLVESIPGNCAWGNGIPSPFHTIVSRRQTQAGCAVLLRRELVPETPQVADAEPHRTGSLRRVDGILLGTVQSAEHW